jgi:hypothetical protein
MGSNIPLNTYKNSHATFQGNNNDNSNMAATITTSSSFVTLVPPMHYHHHYQQQQQQSDRLYTLTTMTHHSHRHHCRMFSSTPTNLSLNKDHRDKNDADQENMVNAKSSQPKGSLSSSGSSGSSGSSNDNGSSTVEQNTPEKPTFKSMVQKYGKVFVWTYLSVYVSTVLGLYFGIEAGALDPAYIMSWISSPPSDADPESVATTVEVIVEWLNRHAWTKPAAPFVEKYPWAANFGVAWVATKFTEPIRFGVTVAILPTVARRLGYTTPAGAAATTTTTTTTMTSDPSLTNTSKQKHPQNETSA